MISFDLQTTESNSGGSSGSVTEHRGRRDRDVDCENSIFFLYLSIYIIFRWVRAQLRVDCDDNGGWEMSEISPFGRESSEA